MNENHIPSEQKPAAQKSKNQGGYIFLGALLVLSGVLWLMHNFGMVGPRAFDIIFSWQMLMVVIGAYLIATRNYTAGAIVGGLGVIFIMMNLMDVYVSIGKVILPSAVIAAGAALLITKLGKK